MGEKNHILTLRKALVMTFFNDNGVFNDLRDLFERADLLVESNKGVLSCAFAGVSNI